MTGRFYLEVWFSPEELQWLHQFTRLLEMEVWAGKRDYSASVVVAYRALPHASVERGRQAFRASADWLFAQEPIDISVQARWLWQNGPITPEGERLEDREIELADSLEQLMEQWPQQGGLPQ